jgi:nitrogen fixation NifU-like protein
MFGEKARRLIAEMPNCGRMPQPTCYARAENPVCGDQVEVFLKLQDRRISEFQYLVAGCSGSVAGIAALSEMATDSSLEEALEIDSSGISQYLGGVPSIKEHGLELALTAFRSALNQIGI